MTRQLLALALALALAPSCGRPTDLPDERQPKALADLYVAPPERGGDDAHPGDRSDAPLATLARALALAAGVGGDDAVQIAIAQGLYSESLSLPAGLRVALNGGYDNADPLLWTRQGTAASTLLVSPAGAAVLVPAGASLALSRVAAYGGPGAVAGAEVFADEVMTNSLQGAGAVVVLGGEAAISQSLVHGGSGAMGELRAGLFAADGGTVTADLSSLEAGDGSSFPSGLYCGLDADCEVRRCPLVAGGVAERRPIAGNTNQSAGVTGLKPRRLILADNEQVLGREGYYSTAVWSLNAGEMAVSGNELIRSGSGLAGSIGMLLIQGEGSLVIEGNATIEGGTSDGSAGIQINGGAPVIRNNHFIFGGEARMSSIGLALFQVEGGVVEGNEGIAGGSGFQTAGLMMNYATARVRANSIDGGQAVYDAVGVELRGDPTQHPTAESLLTGNTVFAGIAGERAVGVLANGTSAALMNNAVLVGGGVRENQGLLLYQEAAPLIAFNTIAVISQTTDKAPPAHATAVRDEGSSAAVIGNLSVLNRWEHGSLLWFPTGADVHGQYSANALYRWDSGNIVPGHPEVSELLLVGPADADPADPDTIVYPAQPDIAAALGALNALADVEASLICFPAWSALGGFGIGFDVRLGVLSSCRGKGPAFSDIRAELAARGLDDITAADFRDLDGEARPMGGANEPGADELTE